MKNRNKIVVLAFLLIAPLLSGCYWNAKVEQSEMGLEFDDGTSLTAVVGPGRYSRFGPWGYARLKTVNVSAMMAEWSDPDLVTMDKQPIGLSVSVTYARRSDTESIEAMWTQYNAEARSDDRLRQQVLTRLPRAAKEVTTQFSLDEMLGVGEIGAELGRQAIQTALFDALRVELDEIHVELLDVGINNIAPSAEYLALLEEKANAVVAVEVARKVTLQLEEQLNQERAQTEIEIEQARRANLVAQENAKVFEQSEQWYRLTYLQRLAGVFDGDNVWFIDPDMDLTLLFSEGTQPTFTPIPIPAPSADGAVVPSP